MKKPILAAFVSAVLFACSYSVTPQRDRNGKTIIAGEVINTPEHIRVVQVNYCDPLSEEHRYSVDLTKSGGSFHTEHEYFFSQNLTIRIEDKFINFFVNPGDSVFLTIDAIKLFDDEDGAVTFSGDNARFNDELYKWTSYAYSQTFTELDESAPEEEFLASLKETLRNARTMIDNYAAVNGMSDEMKQWAYNDYKYIIANTIMGYADSESKWRVFTDPAFDVFNENNFSSMYFQYHLASCMDALISGDESIVELFRQEKLTEGWELLTEKLRTLAQEGIVRDMILYKFAHNILSERPELYDSLPGLAEFFSEPRFAASIGDLVHNKQVKIASTGIKGVTTEGISYLDNDTVKEVPGTDLMEHLMDKYKGKVLYIDVWATWCGPCIEEMQLSPQLHEYFEGKDVVFVNLCLHSDPAQWSLRIAEQEHAVENYFLDPENSNMFMGAFNLSGFPSYMIIDKEGNLHSPVPQPSQTALAAYAIERLL